MRFILFISFLSTLGCAHNSYGVGNNDGNTKNQMRQENLLSNQNQETPSNKKDIDPLRSAPGYAPCDSDSKLLNYQNELIKLQEKRIRELKNELENLSR